MKQKYYVELNRQEWRLIIEGLNRFRNKLIAAGRYTDAVDEILIKVAKAMHNMQFHRRASCHQARIATTSFLTKSKPLQLSLLYYPLSFEDCSDNTQTYCVQGLLAPLTCKHLH